jgi:hypothetical protein
MKVATAIWLVLLVAAPARVFAQDIYKQPPASKEAPPATQPPIAQLPASQAPGSQAATTLTRETWRRSMARTPFPKAGCYTSSYPSTQWQEVPCSTAKAVPHIPPVADSKPHNVGAGANYSAQVTGSLSQVIGSFDSVIGATGESDSSAGNENFSLQLNANTFSSPLCDNPNCNGLQQYAYDSPGNVYIQYWLRFHGSTCPSKTVANNAWAYYNGSSGGAPGCYINGNQASVPSQPITELAGLRLAANNSPGAHSAVLETSGGTLYGGQDDGDFLGIGSQWKTAEFGVFGAGNSSTAVITPNPGTTIVVRTSVDNGTTNAPTCAPSGFTNEQNSLTLVQVSPCCPIAGATPAIVVTESNTAGATSQCACPAGFKWDPDNAACACIPKTTVEACSAGQCGGNRSDGCGGTIACPTNCPSGEVCDPTYGNVCCQFPVPGKNLPNQCAPVCPSCPEGYRCAAGIGEPIGYCVVSHLCPAGTHYCAGEPSCLPGESGSCSKQAACTPKTIAEACGALQCAGDMPDGCGGTIACPRNCPRGEVCSATGLCCTPPVPGKTLVNQCPSPASCGSCNPLQSSECCNCNGGLWKAGQCFIPLPR